jgi:general secretion pathway protein A
VGRRESIVLVSGDLGVGKTTLCRTLMEALASRATVAMVSNPLVAPVDLLRLLLQDFGALSPDELRRGLLSELTRPDLQLRLEAFLSHLALTRDSAVLIVDEAHTLPAAAAELIVELSEVTGNGERSLHVVLAGQAPGAGTAALPAPFNNRVATRARLSPLDQDECGRYLSHRVTIAGGGATVSFAPRALEVMFGLSGGLPRLINLIAERALHEAASAASQRVEASMVESAASALEILRLKPRRFRWFGSSEGSARGTL